MLLRSMQQAIYTPINSGHFGLAYPPCAGQLRRGRGIRPSFERHGAPAKAIVRAGHLLGDTPLKKATVKGVSTVPGHDDRQDGLLLNSLGTPSPLDQVACLPDFR